MGGEIQVAKHLRVGYFAQHQVDVLDGETSPLELLGKIDPDTDEQTVRDYLGGFDFRGDRADSRIGNFSGGEKVRLALAVIAWQKPNLLLLDEPTNHLDLEMRHALTVALQQFDGAIIVVSHDRHLLNNTVTEFHAISNGRLSRFDGDLADYQKLIQREQNTSGETSGSTTTDSENEPIDRKAQRQQAAARRQMLAPLRREISGLETTMEQLNSELTRIEEKLLDSSPLRRRQSGSLERAAVGAGSAEVRARGVRRKMAGTQ